MTMKQEFLKACETGDTAALKALMATPNFDFNICDTALMFSALRGYTVAVTFLLTIPRIEVNMRHRNTGDTPLMWAILNGHMDTVRVLLDAPDINVNICDNEGNTALMLAALNGHTSTVTALLDVPGIEVNICNNEGNTALMLAASNGHATTITALLNAVNIAVNTHNNAPSGGDTALILAATNGHAATVTALLNAICIDINKHNYSGDTALMRAALNSHTAVIIALLDAPAPFHIDSNMRHAQTGITDLILATLNGNRDSVTALLNVLNIDEVNRHDNTGKTALMWAALNGNTAVVRALLAIPGVDLNTHDNTGKTALMWAALNGNTAVVRALLAIPGIDIHRMNDQAETAITLAFENEHHAIVTLLQNQGAVLPEHLRQARNDINGEQSVHEVSVHVSVANSAKNLIKHYSYTQEQVINTINELTAWLNTSFTNPSELPREYKPEHLEPAKRCVSRLNTLNYTDSRSGVTIQQALALVWIGINNPHAKGENTPRLGEQELIDRRISFVKELYEIQRGYNLSDGANPVDDGGDDQLTCSPGSFNKLIGVLSEVGHQGVQIIFVTQALINEKVPFLSQKAFNHLSEENRKRFAQDWESDNSDAVQAEYFDMIKNLVNTKLHELYDEFHAEVPNLEQVITDAAAHIQYTDMSTVMRSEREAIQKKEQEAQAERERTIAAANALASLPNARQKRKEAVIFSCNTRGVKRERPAEEDRRYPKRSTRSFTGTYTK
jgi:ankyrin repeat protein